MSLEGYVDAMLLIAALQQNGPQVDTEKLVTTLENIRDLDIGLGAPMTFSRSEHQAVHKVWGTQIDADGHYQPIRLAVVGDFIASMSQNWSMERFMDPLVISSVGLLAFIVGAAIGWLIARTRFASRVADLNSKLVLERRVNKQLSETLQVADARNYMPVPDLTAPAESARESMVVSG